MTTPQDSADGEFAESSELLTANVTIDSPYDPEVSVNDPRLRRRGVVPGSVSVALGITVLLLTSQVTETGNLPLGPRFWPSMIGWVILVFGIVLLVNFFIRGIKFGDVPDRITLWGLSRFFLSSVLAIAYLLLWGVVPFWASTLVVAFLLILAFGARGLKPLIIFPIVVAALLHFLFVVALRVPL